MELNFLNTENRELFVRRSFVCPFELLFICLEHENSKSTRLSVVNSTLLNDTIVQHGDYAVNNLQVVEILDQLKTLRLKTNTTKLLKMSVFRFSIKRKYNLRGGSATRLFYLQNKNP